MTDRGPVKGMDWLGRTLAIMFLMVLPAILGGWADKQFGTKFLTLIGLAGGMLVGTGMMLLLAQRLIPKGRGKPIPFDDEVEDEEEEEAEANHGQ